MGEFSAEEYLSADVDIQTFPLVAVVLLNVKIETRPDPSPDENSLFYEVVLSSNRTPTAHGGVFVMCEARAGRRRETERDLPAIITATYGMMITCDDAQQTSFSATAKFYARTAVWGRYTSLFSVLTGQLLADFYPLPSDPFDLVRWEDAPEPTANSD